MDTQLGSSRTLARHCSHRGPTAFRGFRKVIFNRIAPRWKDERQPSLLGQPAAKVSEASVSTYDVELQRLLMAGPPADFDFRAEVTPGSRAWVDANAPQLRDLVDDGTLVVVPRRPDYLERRTDGYQEPRVVLLVGTAHVSRRSQRDVVRVVRAVAPDSVVVELCKSRSAALAAAATLDLDLDLDLQPERGAELKTCSSSSVAHATGPDTTITTSPGSTQGARVASSPPVVPLGSTSGSETDSEAPEGHHGAYDSGESSTSTSTSRGDGSTGSNRTVQTTGARPPPAFINPLNLAGGPGAGLGGGGPGGVAGPGGDGGGFLGAVARSVSLGGQSALLLRVLLASLASRTAGSLGVVGGGEFAAAQAAADEVAAQIVLGDRPVEITLSRAWAALSWPRRLALCGELLAGATAPTKEALSEELVERLKSDDAVSAFFNQLSTSYPELVAPLITERDLYLAWSLKRSMAVNGADRVVGVVGRGHMRGVVHALLRDQGGAGLRFTDLVDGRNNRSRRREQAVKGVARFGVELALGTLAYFLWLALTQQS